MDFVSLRPSNKMTAFPGWAFSAVVLFCLFLMPGRSSALGTGDPAPDFRIVTTGGKDISFFSDIKGKNPLYLIFWATW